MQEACQVYHVVNKAVREGGEIVLMTEMSEGLQNCRKKLRISRGDGNGIAFFKGGVELAVGDNLAEGGFANDAGGRSAQPAKRITILL